MTATAVADAERLARVTLSLVAEPGDPVVTGLTDQLGGRGCLDAVRHRPERHAVLEAAAGRLADADPERALERAALAGLRFVVPGDDEWPVSLSDLLHAGIVQERGGPPVGLWLRGPLRLDEAVDRSVAVVGSRTSTTYGDRCAGDIAAEVVGAGVTVMSGAAFGIDYAAHRGAVTGGGRTVAVLACGADRVYPESHRDMLDHLARDHLVVSEAPPGAAPQRVRFLARNRLIAALTAGVVVVEAAARSGALNTLNWAQRLHRAAMGVPGPVTSTASVGVHHQIRLGGASLVTSGRDVLELIGAAGEHLPEDPRGPVDVRDELTLRARQVLDAVPSSRSAGSDSIATVAGLGVLEVHKVLERLHERGLVVRDPAGWHLSDVARPGGSE